MAFDDDDFGTIFPTRFGKATGTANERKMLDNVGGSKSFRHKVRDNGDGSTTRMKTHDGMPRFVTEEEEETTPEEENVTLYMETGQLVWTYPGSENPTAPQQATWRMVNLDPAGRWMGGVKLSKLATLGNQVSPQETPLSGVLADSIPSIAIGYKPTNDPVKQLNLEATTGQLVIQKKLICAYFPPSIFSGKLRLFMQAQYGAPIKPAGMDYSLEISGLSAILRYKPVENTSAPTMQFTFWSHATTGLYSTDDYQYYIVQLEEAAESSLMNVSVIPTKSSSAGVVVRRRLLAGKISAGELHKAEAYLLSTLSIETDKKTMVGSYDPGYCGSGTGMTLCYGWKFNRKGNKASIVRVGSVGSALTNDLDGRAKEIHININRNAVFDGSETGKWTITGSASAEYNWLDGWGSFNIFAPVSETSNELELFSYAIGWDAVGPYDYSGVPVYGYYNAEDEWTTATLSRTNYTGASYGKQRRSSNTNILPSAMDWENYAIPAPPGFMNWLHYTKRYTNETAWVEQQTVLKKHQMTVSVGGSSVQGKREIGTFERWQAGPGGSYVVPPSEGPTYFEGYPPVFDGDIGAIGGAVGPLVNKESDFNNWLASIPYLPYYSGGESFNSAQSTFSIQGTFDKGTRWALVIPSKDCEAVHVATNVFDASYGTKYEDGYAAMVTSKEVYARLSDGEGHAGEWVHTNWQPILCDMDQLSYGWSGASSDFSDDTSIIDVAGWSGTLDGESGTPSNGYGSLFNVSMSNPVYDGVITFYESDGGKYHGTEGFNSGGEIAGLYVGWY